MNLGLSRLTHAVSRPITATRVALLVTAVAVVTTGCAAPGACIGDYGLCKQASLAQRYVIIDPSSSQGPAIEKQVDEVSQIAASGASELTVIRMGERPSTSSIVTRVSLPKIDKTDPNAVATRTALIAKLGHLVKTALARRTTSSDQFGSLALVHDDLGQRAILSPVEVTMLGDSEPCVTGVCWTQTVPDPNQAIRQVQHAYATLDFSGENVTFLVGGDTAASRKAPSYVGRLSAAVVAVCRWGRAVSCTATTTLAEGLS